MIVAIMISSAVVYYVSPTPPVSVTGVKDYQEAAALRQQALSVVGPKIALLKSIVVTDDEDVDIGNDITLAQIQTPDGRTITYVGDGPHASPRLSAGNSCFELEETTCFTKTLEDGSVVNYMCYPYFCSCMHPDGDANC
ncbi:MAG: hypothetical protein ABIH52_02745 [Candidatus Aenigmatarchaeota archaeon]|nr:hypothetical protein [Nanoarchaeota archaeon]